MTAAIVFFGGFLAILLIAFTIVAIIIGIAAYFGAYDDDFW